MIPPKKRVSAARRGRSAQVTPVGLRIIGGRFRGQRIEYGGDRRVRPMKDRVREALFNLLGPEVRQKHAIDLFAGSGALGLEALSRGAARATFIEQHYPTAAVLRRNVSLLHVEEVSQVITSDVFIWFRRSLQAVPEPWLVFCSPPYDFFVERAGAMLELIAGLLDRAPPGSVLVLEADRRFDFAQLPRPDDWRIRAYPPAVLGLFHKSAP